MVAIRSLRDRITSISTPYPNRVVPGARAYLKLPVKSRLRAYWTGAGKPAMKGNRNMGQADTLVAFGGVYSDYEAAKADYEAVRDVYESTDPIETYDAAVIRKKDNGKVKIADKHEQPMHKGAWHGAEWGLAAGLGLALFPAAAIVADCSQLLPAAVRLLVPSRATRPVV